MEIIEYTKAKVSDARDIRLVQDATWMATYVNAEHGITAEDIISHTTAKFEERVKKTEERLAKPGGEPCFIAKDDGKVIGFCWPWLNDEQGRARVGSLYILPEYQGRGVGKQLLTMGLDWLGNDKDVYLQVTVFNDKAKNFYEKFGFVEIEGGEDFVFPTGKKMPTILMVRRKVV